MKRQLLLCLTLIVALASGCAVNPVTGKRELGLVSEAQELEIGKQQYAPTRQMQGGDYTLDPELSRYVNEVGQRLAEVSDRKLPYEFVVLADSTPNAWALPGGKIAVNRGLLLELDNEAELAAVLGHEITHAAARHSAKGIERGMVLQGAVLATGVAVASQDSDYAPLAVGAAALGAQLVNQKYGRDAERESDFFGMDYMARAGYDPQAAVTLQQTFVRLAGERRSDWLSGLFASHPPSPERVENNRRKAATLRQGGEIGRERYQQKIAYIKKTKEAYVAYDKGRKALSKKKPDEALALANEALKLEPREARFYGLRGHVRLSQKRYEAAVTEYNKAVERDDQFFLFYLTRGLAKEKLKDKAGARADLERSMQLLPTKTAQQALAAL
jgi:predicted Zn-dependent protease